MPEQFPCAPAPATGHAGNGPRVLAVDDRPKVRETLSELLDLGAHGVHAAAGAEEAVALLRAQRVDAVSSEVRMPAFVFGSRRPWGGRPGRDLGDPLPAADGHARKCR